MGLLLILFISQIVTLIRESGIAAELKKNDGACSCAFSKTLTAHRTLSVSH